MNCPYISPFCVSLIPIHESVTTLLWIKTQTRSVFYSKASFAIKLKIAMPFLVLVLNRYSVSQSSELRNCFPAKGGETILIYIACLKIAINL